MTNPHIDANVIEYDGVMGQVVSVTPVSIQNDNPPPLHIGKLCAAAERRGVLFTDIVPQGDTGYLDSFRREDLPGSISYGQDEYGRPFVALSVQMRSSDGRTRSGVLTVFQRYASNTQVWVTAGVQAMPLCYSNGEQLTAWLTALVETGECEWTNGRSFALLEL